MTRSRLIVVAVLAFCLAAGCGGTGTVRTEAPLGGTVRLVELTSEGERRAVPEGGITDVDVNSTVEAVMVKPEIATAMGASLATPEPAGRELLERSRAITHITALQREILAKIDAPGSAASVAAKEGVGKLQVECTLAVGSYARSQGHSPSAAFASVGYEYIDRERVAVATALAERLSAPSEPMWRVEAELATKSGSVAPVHLANYDALPESASTHVGRISFDGRALAQDFEAARKLAAEVNAARLRQGGLKAAFIATLAAMWRQLDSAVLETSTNLERDLDGWRKETRAKELVTAVDHLLAEVRGLRQACSQAVALVESAADGAVTAADVDVGGLIACAAAIKASAPEVAGAIRKVLAAAKAATIESEGLKALGGAAGAIEGIGPSAGALSEKLVVADRPISAVPFEDRSAEAIVNTVIEITRTPRTPGDTVRFKPSVIRDGKVSVAGGWREMRLVQEGVRVDVSAAVLFVRAIDDSAPEEVRDGFVAAPAITVALHSRWGRESGDNVATWGKRTWNYVDPAFAIHIAYPDLGGTEDDPSTEFGIGGSLLLFGDLLQAGMGYDIQAATPYLFLGFGTKTAAKLGITLPSAGAPAPVDTP